MRGSRKFHDIYSLGGFLVEITHRKPVEQVMNRLQNSKRCGNQQISLSKHSLTKVESIAGKAYTNGCRYKSLSGLPEASSVGSLDRSGRAYS